MLWKANLKSTCKYYAIRTQNIRACLTSEAVKKRAWKQEAER
jgi:hypothetical protein